MPPPSMPSLHPLHLRMIRESSENLLNIINDLLDISKIDCVPDRQVAIVSFKLKQSGEFHESSI
jgi:signal transduction histidine kinase